MVLTIGNDKKIYIIHSDKYSLERVKLELEDEGYPYNFHFDGKSIALEDSDEVWLFGDCDDLFDYFAAKSLGKSLWQMG